MACFQLSAAAYATAPSFRTGHTFRMSGRLVVTATPCVLRFFAQTGVHPPGSAIFPVRFLMTFVNHDVSYLH